MNGQLPPWAAAQGATMDGLNAYRRRRAAGAPIGEEALTLNGQPVGGMRPATPDQGQNQVASGPAPVTPDAGVNQVGGGRRRVNPGGRRVHGGGGAAGGPVAGGPAPAPAGIPGRSVTGAVAGAPMERASGVGARSDPAAMGDPGFVGTPDKGATGGALPPATGNRPAPPRRPMMSPAERAAAIDQDRAMFGLPPLNGGATLPPSPALPPTPTTGGVMPGPVNDVAAAAHPGPLGGPTPAPVPHPGPLGGPTVVGGSSGGPITGGGGMTNTPPILAPDPDAMKNALIQRRGVPNNRPRY